jgi:hypothetical protein
MADRSGGRPALLAPASAGAAVRWSSYGHQVVRLMTLTPRPDARPSATARHQAPGASDAAHHGRVAQQQVVQLRALQGPATAADRRGLTSAAPGKREPAASGAAASARPIPSRTHVVGSSRKSA